MIHLLIDTSIYRQDPRRQKAGFEAIERLAQFGFIKLHIPYVVFKEFVTQQEASYAKRVKEATDAFDSILKMPVNLAINDAIHELKDQLEILKSAIDSFPETEFVDWAKRLSATIHPIASNHGEAVMKSYFDGDAPFEDRKNRNDIPDAFIWQTALDLQKKHGHLIVLSHDGELKVSCENYDGITVFAAMDDFLKSPHFQELIQPEPTGNVMGFLTENLKRTPNSLTQFIDKNCSEALCNKEFSDSRIPEDNGEATIRYSEAEGEAALDLTDIRYLGDGVFIVPFSIRCRARVDYCISKSDFYGLPEERSNWISIEDWNGHSFMAEEELLLLVQGRLAVRLDPSVSDLSVTKSQFEQIFENANISFDEFGEISVEDPRNDEY